MLICPTCRRSFPGNTRFCTQDASQLVEEAELDRLGTVIGNYRLLGIMGRGGMGTVYSAEHVYIAKPVAVKILHMRFAQNDGAVKRFLREARAASSINHPNIVDVTDFGHAPDGCVYFVMEYLDGRSLENVLDVEGKLQLHRAINIVGQLASALAAAHDKGIIHRDLKPENIMLIQRPGRRELIRSLGKNAEGGVEFTVEKEGDYDFVKILDFGIAKVQDPDSDSLQANTTSVGAVFGTPEYMSPEQARGQTVDHRADIYALGVMFYDMLTGKVPFAAEAPVDVLHMHINTPPVPPSQAAPTAEITPAVERLILRALSKNPAERPQSMDALRAELASCYGSVAYRRDARNVPGALGAGITPRARRLTEEIDEWLSQHRDELVLAHRRMQQIADTPSGPTDFDWAELAATAGDVEATAAVADDGTPVLLTQKKP